VQHRLRRGEGWRAGAGPFGITLLIFPNGDPINPEARLAAVRSQTISGGRAPRRPGLALAVIATAQLMVVIELNVVTVALPGARGPRRGPFADARKMTREDRAADPSLTRGR
jgi:hypothetical protein